MSDVTQRNVSYRNKRKSGSRILIWWLITLSIPCILCVILFFRMLLLERDLKRLEERLTNTTELLQTEILKGRQQMEEFSAALEKQQELSVQAESEIFSEQEGEQEQEPQEDLTEYQHKVYLTFDDGPSVYTDDILDILAEYGVKATFFVVGKESDYAQEMLKRIVDEGHTLGMHSYSHVYRDIYSSVDAFAEDFQKLRKYLYDVTGVECRNYRFPGGSSNTVSSLDMRYFIDYLTQEGVVFHDWNVSSGDASNRTVDVNTLVKNSLKNISGRGTSVILMHDAANKGTTVEALPIIIEKLLEMEDTVILPITENMTPVQHVHVEEEEQLSEEEDGTAQSGAAQESQTTQESGAQESGATEESQTAQESSAAQESQAVEENAAQESQAAQESVTQESNGTEENVAQ